MNENRDLIVRFYTAFQNKDYKTMAACYDDHAMFSDPIFKNLDARHTKAMWKMFCLTGKKLQIEFRNVAADEKSGSAEWIATYAFTSAERPVVNHITAHFIFENGRIKKHTDAFDFYKWAKQALGSMGILFGWLPLMQAIVSKSGMKELEDYITAHPSPGEDRNIYNPDHRTRD